MLCASRPNILKGIKKVTHKKKYFFPSLPPVSEVQLDVSLPRVDILLALAMRMALTLLAALPVM